MTTRWTLTVDCHDAGRLMAFWRTAIGYVDASPPEGWDAWEAWLRHFDVPEEQWGDGGRLSDPEGRLPDLSFLKVPEGKTAKNRIHLDLQVSGGRHLPADVRRARITAHVERLIAVGGTVQQEVMLGSDLDHVVIVDPEGNELCVV